MILLNNPFGQDAMDFDNDTAANRIGNRIREIRLARNLSQAELGEVIGLNADRVQKYENGARKPKDDMLKKIADALEVNPLALLDPVTTNYIGAIFAMFEMEHIFNMKIEKRSDNTLGLYLTDDFTNNLYEYMEEWYKAYVQYKTELGAASSDAEREEIKKSYRLWQCSFPRSIIDRTERNIQKMRLKKKIEELQKAYDLLDQEGSGLE